MLQIQRTSTLVRHSVEYLEFFCYSNFTLNQFLGIFAILEALNFVQLVDFSLQQYTKVHRRKSEIHSL